MNPKNTFAPLESVVIFLLHIFMLGWLFYILGNAGEWSFTATLQHFVGISLYGALLIRYCSYRAMYRYKKGNTSS